jgi:putative transposase
MSPMRVQTQHAKILTTTQAGYGAFSIGQSNVEALKRYLRGQKRHHTRITFQDEFRKFLKRYQIDYDERYVWD